MKRLLTSKEQLKPVISWKQDDGISSLSKPERIFIDWNWMSLKIFSHTNETLRKRDKNISKCSYWMWQKVIYMNIWRKINQLPWSIDENHTGMLNTNTKLMTRNTTREVHKMWLLKQYQYSCHSSIAIANNESYQYLMLWNRQDIVSHRHHTILLCTYGKQHTRWHTHSRSPQSNTHLHTNKETIPFHIGTP